ncbi:uncharacterized protein LOC129871331 [Solanum dulcamara]|uniref:uncharacterized protein LOC129871331 n=1 Tax=Solanum dulcamara TaxID=45834 RepID=UPI0024856EAB|nr:uncharacterized protein LOC129871331 [Solanum dulcamara]
MARGRKMMEVLKMVVNPKGVESIYLETQVGSEETQGKESMEQWPPFALKEVTPRTNEIMQLTLCSVSKSQDGTSKNQTMEIIEKSSRGTTQRKLEMNKEPEKKWAIFFNSNRFSAKGMSLSNVNLEMKNGKKVIELKKDEVDKATKEWKQALILYVVRESPTIAAIERRGKKLRS